MLVSDAHDKGACLKGTRTAFVTYRGLPGLSADDRLALNYLYRQGAAPKIVVWDDVDVDWESFDCVIIRSCWDYHLRPAEFADWVSCMERKGVSLWNPPRVVRWNVDKTYLSSLERKGVCVPPTVWLEKGSAADLGTILGQKGWSRAVVKPTVSATAFQTWVTCPARAGRDAPTLQEMLLKSGVMVQRFIKEVRTKGEWSFVFYDKKYSHAVLKRAKSEDFRVQSDFGGYLAEDAKPTSRLVEQARLVVELVEEPLLYARVDAVEVGGRLMLMELELIEPALFFGADPRSPGRLADAIISIQKVRSEVIAKEDATTSSSARSF